MTKRTLCIIAMLLVGTVIYTSLPAQPIEPSVTFLVKAVDNTHSDPVEDARASWKRGDIVDVRDSSWRWGREEGPPKFVRVTVAGLDLATAKAYLRPSTQPATKPTDPPRMIRRRQYQMSIGSLSATDQAKLEMTGTLELQKTSLEAVIRNTVADPSTQPTKPANRESVR